MGSYFFYGPPGTGKTTLACRACEIGWKAHVISVDRKIKTQTNLQSWVKEGTLTYQDVDRPLSGDSLADMASKPMEIIPGKMGKTKKAPGGYMQICEMIDGHSESPMEDAYKTILVLDPMSQVNEHLKRLLKYYSNTSKLGFDEWDAVLVNYEELFSTFYSLQPEPYAHCIVISHSHDKDFYISETVGGKIKQTFDHTETVPLLDGQFRDKAMGLVEEGYYFGVEAFTKQQKPKFKILTVPIGNVKHARTSKGLGTWDEADPLEVFGKAP